MERGGSGVWAAVGKVVTALGGGAALVLSAISIYTYFTAAKSELRASIEVNDFAMPPAILAAAKRDFDEKAKDFLDEGRGKAAADQGAPGNSATAVSREFERFAAWVPADPEGLSQYVRVQVSNDGTLTAKGVSLAVPFQFQTVSVRREDGSVETFKSPRRIALGDISPREAVTIRAWSTIPQDLFGVDRLQDSLLLSYEGGLGTVEIVEDRFQNPAKRLAKLSAAMFGALMGLVLLATTTLLKRGIEVRVTKQ